MATTQNATRQPFYKQFKQSVDYHEKKKQRLEKTSQDTHTYSSQNDQKFKITRSIRLIKVEKFINWLKLPNVAAELKAKHAEEYKEKLAYFEAYLKKYIATITTNHRKIYAIITFPKLREWLIKIKKWDDNYKKETSL